MHISRARKGHSHRGIYLNRVKLCLFLAFQEGIKKNGSARCYQHLTDPDHALKRGKRMAGMQFTQIDFIQQLSCYNLATLHDALTSFACSPEIMPVWAQRRIL